MARPLLLKRGKSSQLLAPVRAERGRVTATITAAGATALLLGLVYFADFDLLGETGKQFVLALIPNLIVVIIAFILVAVGQGLGLWQRTDKLNLIVEYLDEQRLSRAKEISLFVSPHEIPWSAVFAPPSSISFLCNFAVLPLRQGAQALRSNLDTHRSGHIFVFLNPEAEAAVAQLAETRKNLDFASSPAGLNRAILESLALLLELLPHGKTDGARTLPGVRVLLAASPLSFAAFWTSDAAIYMGAESFPGGAVGSPRMVLTGESSAALRAFNESAVRTLVEEGALEPTVNELLVLASKIRNPEWLARMQRRLVQ